MVFMENVKKLLVGKAWEGIVCTPFSGFASIIANNAGCIQQQWGNFWLRQRFLPLWGAFLGGAFLEEGLADFIPGFLPAGFVVGLPLETDFGGAV